jgi:hypothetical protein
MSSKEVSTMSTHPVRLVLENVPPVGFYGSVPGGAAGICPEDITFPSALRTVLEYIGDECLGCQHRPRGVAGACTACGYGFLMTVSGAAFGLHWQPGRWDFGEGSVLRQSANAAEPIRWAAESVGYPCTVLGNAALDVEGQFPEHGDEAAMRALIIGSLTAGRPVLAWGVVGPPECCIITGYDEDGDVLIGWNFFQSMPEFGVGLEFEPAGAQAGQYFRRRDWFSNTWAVMTLGERGPIPALAGVYAQTLRRGLAVMQTPVIRQTWASGIAAWDAWIDALLDDANFAPDDPQLEVRHGAHSDTVGMIAELRYYAAPILKEMAAIYPLAAGSLGRAAGHFLRIHDLMWRVWECVWDNPTMGGATGEDTTPADWPVDQAHRFARRDTREQIVAVLRLAQAADAEATQCIEDALKVIERPATSHMTVPVIPRRVVLEDVPHIGFAAARNGGTIEATFVCAALKSALARLGEPATYEFLMGTSGAAFRLCWNAGRWDGGNLSTLNMGDDPTEPVRRMCQAVGWDVKIIGNTAWKHPDPTLPPPNIYIGPDYLGDNVEYLDVAALRAALVESIHDRGYPLLSVGGVLPPEFGVVAGYDDDGDTLIGWHHFQNWPENRNSGRLSYEPSGYYHNQDWYQDTVGLLVFQNKGPKSPLAETYRRSLAWAVKLSRTPRFRQYYSGLAAFDAWAAAIGREDDDVSPDLRLMCHKDAAGSIADGRMVGPAYLRSVARVLPGAADCLEGAARAYDAQLQTMIRIMDLLGGWDEDAAKAAKLTEPAIRTQTVALIYEARSQEEEAVTNLEAALAAIE